MTILLNLLLLPSTFIGAELYISKLGRGMHQVSEISIFPQFSPRYVHACRTIFERITKRAFRLQTGLRILILGAPGMLGQGRFSLRPGIIQPISGDACLRGRISEQLR